MQLKDNNNDLDFAIQQIITSYRKLILDTIEQEAGGSERWGFLRKRLLSYLGDSGMAGEVSEIIQQHFIKDK